MFLELLSHALVLFGFHRLPCHGSFRAFPHTLDGEETSDCGNCVLPCGSRFHGMVVLVERCAGSAYRYAYSRVGLGVLHAQRALRHFRTLFDFHLHRSKQIVQADHGNFQTLLRHISHAHVFPCSHCGVLCKRKSGKSHCSRLFGNTLHSVADIRVLHNHRKTVVVCPRQPLVLGGLMQKQSIEYRISPCNRLKSRE